LQRIAESACPVDAHVGDFLAKLHSRDREDQEMSSTKDVLDHHLKSFGEGDLNGILSDYAPKAILFTPDGPVEGVDAIRRLFKGLLAEFAKPGSSFKLRHQSIKGAYAYILWTAETADNSYDLATDTFVVQDGKIVAQSFAARILPKGL
jgi:ketosteroid isomerase-like protein